MREKYDRLRDPGVDEQRSNKADTFWNAFRLTENGKVKSTLMLNSFCLCVVYIAVYFGAICLLVDPLHALTRNLPTWVENMVSSIVPAFVGTAVCSLTWLVAREKRMMVSTYAWITVLSVASLIALLILMRDDGHAQLLALQFFALFFLPGIVMGCALSLALYHRYWKAEQIRRAALEREPWKRM